VSVCLLIFTLNEIDGMKKVVPQINPDWVDEILIMDGGSTDGTIEEAKKMGLRIIVQKNKGHGSALIEGVEAIKSDNFILFGPDGNHDVSEIPLLVSKIKEGYDQVLISRFGKGSINLDAVGIKGKLIDQFGNKLFAFLVNVFFGGHMTDSLNESRIISKKAFYELKFDALKMDSTQQMSIRSLKKNQKIYEIIGNEGERIGGQRKMRPLQVGTDLSLQILKEFFYW
jgi:glycosyltransferase involved in cell wall biosynthesis